MNQSLTQEQIFSFIQHTFEKFITHSETKEWLTLKDGAKYAGVSYNTFIKFRALGLQICEVEGLKRVSKTEINRFLEEYSY